jgi:hypothetical protein
MFHNTYAKCEYPQPLLDYPPGQPRRDVARARLSNSKCEGIDIGDVILRGLVFDNEVKVWIPQILYPFLDHDDPIRQGVLRENSPMPMIPLHC